MTYEEYKAAWNALTEAQQQWVRNKARWEHMTRWAVMNEWDVPTTPDPRAADPASLLAVAFREQP